MKRIILFLFAVPFLFATISAEGNKAPEGGTVALVKKIIKDVSFKKLDASDWEVAKTGTPLKDGEQVKTGSKSMALVLFTEGSLLRVRENSILNIYGKKEGNNVSRNTFIQKGTLGFEVKKQGDDEFKFTTPTAVASIRGTGGAIIADSMETQILLDNGEVYVESSQDPSKNGTVNGGEKLIVDNNGNFQKSTLGDDDKKLLNNAMTQTPKKIIFKTPYGDIEIEYNPEQQ